MKLNHLCTFAAVLCLASTLESRAATPAVGQPAPPLTFTQLFGAPEGTKTDWASLHGKVIVLEFWATWCAPCIAEIPHLNELANSLASNNVQFISVDDEDPAVVKDFLAKKHMESWVGVSKQAFDDYGVQARPTTIVIDPQGKIAAMLRPERLAKEPLIALSEGKPALFPTNIVPAQLTEAQQKQMHDAVAAMKNPGADAGPKPLFEISIRPGQPDGPTMIFTGNDTKTGQSSYDMRNVPLSDLISWAEAVPDNRVVIHAGVGKATYSLHVSAPDLDLEQLAPALQAAIASAAGVKLTHLSAEEDAYVLQATPQTAARLVATVSNHGSMCYLDPESGKLSMVNTSLDDMVTTLEEALGKPVVNEVRIQGEFDAEFMLPKDNFDAAKAALEANMGITLVPARRAIERTVVDSLPAASKPSKPASVADTPAMVPGQPVNPERSVNSGQPVKMIAVPRPQP
jgi:uncharacterized protein (TIGR03435 family)